MPHPRGNAKKRIKLSKIKLHEITIFNAPSQAIIGFRKQESAVDVGYEIDFSH